MVTKRQGVLLALWLALALILRFVCTACDYLAYSIVFGVLVWAAYRALRHLAATKARLARHLRRALSLLLALCAVWFLGTEVYLISGARTDDTTPCQYIVVLGAQVRGTQPSPRHAGPDRRRSRLSFCASGRHLHRFRRPGAWGEDYGGCLHAPSAAGRGHPRHAHLAGTEGQRYGGKPGQ